MRFRHPLLCWLLVAPLALTGWAILEACTDHTSCQDDLTCDALAPAGGGGGAGTGGTGGSGGSQPALCGDGVRTAPEACDDGNQLDADGCEADCTLPRCGNQILDPGEICFTAPLVEIETGGPSVLDVLVVDCDADGDLDIITVDTDGATFTVLENDGAGALQAPKTFDSGLESLPRPYLVLAEADGQPGAEIFATGRTAADGAVFAHYLLHDACQITKTAVISGPLITPGDVAIVRFVGDDRDDPVTPSTEGGGGLLYWLDSQTTTIKGGQAFLATQPASVLSAALNADNLLDLAFAHPNENLIRIRFNGGAGLTTDTPEVAVSGAPTALASGDLDGDGDVDLVSANLTGGSVTVLQNDGAGAFTVLGDDLPVDFKTGVTASAPQDIALGDLDADGDLDIVTANSGDADAHSSVSAFVNDGNASFQPATSALFSQIERSFPVEVGRRPYRIAVVDMNGDGALDIVTAGAYETNGISRVTVLLAQP